MPTDTLQQMLAMPANHGLAVEIAVRLRGAILSGHFGPGERLREEALASAMSVSRGPIREALVQLEREALIVIRRNRGAFVAQLSLQDLEEVYTLRVAIERLAIQRAARFATRATIEAMQTVVAAIVAATARGITEQEAAELDVRFHDLTYEAANHRRLYEAWTNLRPQIHILLLNRNVADQDFRDYVVTSHQAILDALRDHDEPRAVDLIEDHLRGSYERIVVSHEARVHDGHHNDPVMAIPEPGRRAP